MIETSRPLKMSGEEIERTFGSTEVLQLEKNCEALQEQINGLRDQLSDHWDDADFVIATEENIEDLDNKLKQFRAELRQKRNKYGQTVSETTLLS